MDGMRSHPVGFALLLFILLAPADGLSDTPLRLVAANLTSGSSQSYEAPGSRILMGLDADVVLIQEFKVGANSSAELDSFVDSTFGTEFHWYREGGNGGIPNGIISRWPMLGQGEWNDTSVSDRDFAWARIDIPGSRDLWVVSIHFLTKSSSSRNTEAKQLVSYIKSQGIPSSDYLVIAGDLNTTSRSESCVSTLSQVVLTGSPYPVDQKGDGDTNSGRSSPYDWVLADSDLDALEVPVRIGNNSFSAGFIADTRVYSPISDLYPAQSGDSGATNMQHMAVVRDFLIPEDADPPIALDPVLLTEIMYAPSTGSPEWIELHNPNEEPFDLGGLLLTDNEGSDLNEGEFYFPANTILDAGGYLVIGSASVEWVDLVWTASLVLANAGDDLYLVSDSARDGLFAASDILDGTRYYSNWGGSQGRSLSRTCLSCDPALSSSWASSAAVGGTPGLVNDTF